MLKSQVDSAALVATALAATLALTLLAGPFAWMGSIIGLVLVLVLFSFDQEGYRTVAGSLAFSAVCGFCFAVGCGALFSLMAAHGEVHLADGAWQSEWLPFTFLFATAILWAIDRSRMSARAPVSERMASHPGGIQSSFIRSAEPQVAAPAASVFAPGRTYVPPVQQPAASSFEPAPAYSPQPVAPQAWIHPVAPQPSSSQPAFSQPAFSQPPVLTRQPLAVPQPIAAPQPIANPEPIVAPPPAYAEQPPMSGSPAAGPAHPQSMLTHTLTPTPSEPARPAPQSIVSRGGKETMIYVSLLGEGLNVMRTVKAEHLGRDYYQIMDTMPEGETWQFQPGQVVRCKKQNLSTGKAMVAVEEAPRAQ